MILKYAKFYSEVIRAKPIFVPIVKLSMILDILFSCVSYQEHRRSLIKELKNQKIDETLVSLLNCENKHVVSALAGFIASID